MTKTIQEFPLRYDRGKSSDCLLIFTGINGTIEGYEGKYQRIAEEVLSKTEYSVCRIALLSGAWNDLEGYLQKARDFLYEKSDGEEIDVIAMGCSAGANLLLCHGKDFPQIRRILAINPVLNVNIHRILKGIQSFPGEEIDVVVGKKDPSYPLVGLLPQDPKLKCAVLDEVDHAFRGQLETFMQLPWRFLLRDGG